MTLSEQCSYLFKLLRWKVTRFSSKASTKGRGGRHSFLICTILDQSFFCWIHGKARIPDLKLLVSIYQGTRFCFTSLYQASNTYYAEVNKRWHNRGSSWRKILCALALFGKHHISEMPDNRFRSNKEQN